MSIWWRLCITNRSPATISCRRPHVTAEYPPEKQGTLHIPAKRQMFFMCFLMFSALFCVMHWILTAVLFHIYLHSRKYVWHRTAAHGTTDDCPKISGIWMLQHIPICRAWNHGMPELFSEKNLPVLLRVRCLVEMPTLRLWTIFF